MFKYLVILAAIVCALPTQSEAYHTRQPSFSIQFGTGYGPDPWAGPGNYYGIWFSNQYEYDRWCRRQYYSRGPFGPGYGYGYGFDYEAYEYAPRRRGYYYSRGGWKHDRDRRHHDHRGERRGRGDHHSRGGRGSHHRRH